MQVVATAIVLRTLTVSWTALSPHVCAQPLVSPQAQDLGQLWHALQAGQAEQAGQHGLRGVDGAEVGVGVIGEGAHD